MLVMGKIKLIKDFQEWKKMVHDSGDKIKEYGMTFVFAESRQMIPQFYILLFTLSPWSI